MPLLFRFSGQTLESWCVLPQRNPSSSCAICQKKWPHLRSQTRGLLKTVSKTLLRSACLCVKNTVLQRHIFNTHGQEKTWANSILWWCVQVLGEIQEVVKTGLWVGDCFIYTSSVNRLNYFVGGEIVTIAHLDRCSQKLYLKPVSGPHTNIKFFFTSSKWMV